MKKSDKTKTHDDKRRAFLRGGAILGAGATLVATTPGIAAPLEEKPVADQAAAEPEKKGYQLTEHVAAYYRNAAS